jgi:hypothetical protein
MLINTTHLFLPGVVAKITRKFAEESSIELQHFLRKDKYEELVRILSCSSRITALSPSRKLHAAAVAGGGPGADGVVAVRAGEQEELWHPA